MRSVDLDPAEEEERLVAAYPALRRFAFVLADRDADPKREVVAEFAVESGWQLPIDYFSNETPVSTGASLSVV